MAGSEKKKRIVVKVGTSTLTHDGGGLNLRSFDAISRAISDIQNQGHEVILVSSGAIAVGAFKMNMPERPAALDLKQAAAAVGQCELMHLYDKFFGEYGKTVAQILLTGDDVEHPQKRQNLINTFNALMRLSIIPIVNENDSLSFAEIETKAAEYTVLGDNDTLSAIITIFVEADLLVLLSDIDGLYDANPAERADAQLIREVREIDEKVMSLAGGVGTARGTGGMITKLHAARLAMEHGIDMVIANGKKPEQLYDIVEGKPAGTLFVGKKV